MLGPQAWTTAMSCGLEDPGMPRSPFFDAQGRVFSKGAAFEGGPLGVALSPSMR